MMAPSFFFLLSLLGLTTSSVPAEEFQLMNQPLGESFVLRGRLQFKGASRSGRVELALHHTDGSHHLELHFSRSRARLVKIDGNRWEVIGEGRYPRNRRSLDFRLFRNSWKIVLLVNRRHVFQAYDQSMKQGTIGVRQIGKGISLASFNHQPLSTIYFADDFTRSPSSQGEWESVSGSFKLHELEAHRKDRQVYSANQFRWESQGEKRDLSVAGHWFWKNYHYAASVRPSGPGTLGLIIWYQDEDNYVAFRCESREYSSRSELVRVKNGNPHVLAESEHGIEPMQWYGLSIKAVDGRIEGCIDGRQVCAAVLDEFQCGRIGLLAESTSIQIDDIVVKSVDGIYQRPSEWPRPMRTALPNLPKVSLVQFGTNNWKEPSCSIATDGGRIPFIGILYGLNGNSRYGMVEVRQDGNQNLIEISRRNGDRHTSLGKAVLPHKFASVKLDVKGTQVSAIVDGKNVVTVSDAGGATGAIGAAWKYGTKRPFKDLFVSFPVEVNLQSKINPDFARQSSMASWATDVGSKSSLDDTFSFAPVNWWAHRGVWDVIPRWPCDDRWSWLGGIESESPVLWSKKRFSGDMVVEAWLALYMDDINDPSVGYRHPSDLNVTICGDGRNLSSGYSFLFGAESNTVSQIRRGSKVVAETSAYRMNDPRRLNLTFQRKWFYFRIEKRGTKIKYYVDDDLALEYEDPQPLKGGQVALWTWRGGLMVARARVTAAATNLANRRLLPPLQKNGARSAWKTKRNPTRLVATFSSGSGGWTTARNEQGIRHGTVTEKGRSFLQVRNEVSGGSFRVRCRLRDYDVNKAPSLSFDFKADPGTAINLYLRLNDGTVIIPITAGEQAERGLVKLPAAGGAADGKWHSVHYKLLDALKKEFPTSLKLVVSEIAFGAPFAEYLRSGIGGNPFGCVYRISNLQLIASEGVREDVMKALVKSR